MVANGGNGREMYSLCDIVDHHGAVCIPVVHGGQGLVSFLTGSIPYLKFDRGVLI